jgi:sugar phosphate isomerase/epimerase
MASVSFSVFSKPWKTQSLAELGELVRALGYDGIEFPVRSGYQVEPENVVRDLPEAARQLAEYGVRIFSVAAPSGEATIAAGPTDEATIVACAEAGVPIIRTMARVARGERYTEAEERYRRQYEALLPLLEGHGVTLGVQNHCDRHVTHAVGLRALLQGFDPRYVAAVWDAAHEALSGSPPDLALDAIWPHLCMVNLKNGIWQRSNGPEAAYAEWRHYWTSGRHGLAVWPRVIEALKERQYEGVVCLTAEYSDQTLVERLAGEDLAYAKSLFER